MTDFFFLVFGSVSSSFFTEMKVNVGCVARSGEHSRPRFVQTRMMFLVESNAARNRRIKVKAEQRVASFLVTAASLDEERGRGKSEYRIAVTPEARSSKSETNSKDRSGRMIKTGRIRFEFSS